MRSIIDGERKQTAAAIQVAMQLEEKGARRSQMETKGEKKERKKAENTHTHTQQHLFKHDAAGWFARPSFRRCSRFNCYCFCFKHIHRPPLCIITAGYWKT